MSDISLTRIINLVIDLKGKIEKYREKLVKNEMLVRYTLIDPFLRALGWDTENPEQVEPEYDVGGEKPDYALKLGGRVVAFVEAKSLNGITEKVIRDKQRYSVDSGVRYTVITDGNLWLVYDVFKEVPWREKEICRWSITEEDPAIIAIKSLIIANTSAFGKQVEKPLLERQVEQQLQIARVTMVKIKGPINARKANYLVLRVLAETGGPLGRKEIVEKSREIVELVENDLKETETGIERWEAQIRWAITRLVAEGRIRRLNRNQYVISEEGKSYLKTLEEDVTRSV